MKNSIKNWGAQQQNYHKFPEENKKTKFFRIVTLALFSFGR